MVHFPATLTLIHSNLGIKKDKVSLIHQTQGTYFVMKKRKKGGTLGRRWKFSSTTLAIQTRALSISKTNPKLDSNSKANLFP